ncbi:homoserine dehydrogenase [Aliidongia dinghuensis]|uniref:Homoserine dehydrogenase n=1 Tax=Aliidongia dinghuensis TaxID=1867774 RepID=A0A8J2YVI6_9PROT|nr:homoserine dehydrogenase [Aliidongia dinghuensis]GGF28166.1 homoserine dehydrogenase [Aliidongia dinghuensis]
MVASAPLRIGVAGLGTVGAGVVKLLEDNRALLTQRAGRRIEIAAVSARRRAADRGVDLSGFAWQDDPLAIADDPSIDVVVELMGGEAGPALALVERALANGKSVVTANKALLAHHGSRLGQIARQRGVGLCFEASVAGGIPVIKALREGLVGNRISRISGILNGTCNYILSTMRETGRAFDDVLADAQKLGYAEADPTLDIDGWDAAHKLAVLAGIAFGTPVDFERVYVEGIRHISPLDIEYAEELGFRIKLLGTAVRTERGIEQRVHPTMVQATEAIAQVDGVFNAVVIEGDHVGRVVLQGRGAGAGPTASAVVADLVDLATGRLSPAFVEAAEGGIGPVSMSEHDGPSYVRLMVRDQPGVIADIAAELRNERVSMEAMIQRRHHPGGAVPVVLTTHPSKEAALSRALERIGALESVLEPPRMIRIEL